jgi:hypothetical protein
MAHDPNTYALAFQINIEAKQAMSQINDMVKQISDIQKQFEKAIVINVKNDGASQAISQNKDLNTVIQGVNQSILGATDTFVQVSKEYQDAQGDVDKLNQFYVKWGNTLSDTRKEMETGLGILKDLGESDNAAAAAVEKAFKAYRQMEVDIAKTNTAEEANNKAMQANIQKTNEWVDTIGKAVGFLDPFGGKVSQIFNVAATGFKKLIAYTPPAQNGMAGVAKGAQAMAGGAGNAAKAVGNLAKGAAPIKALGGAAGAAAKGMGAAGAGAGAAGAALGPLAIAVVAAQVAWEALKVAAGMAADALEAAGMGATASGRAFMDGLRSLNPFKMAVSFVTSALKEFVEIEQEFRTVTFRAYGTIKETSKAVGEMQKQFQFTAKEARQVISAVTTVGLTLLATKKEVKDLSVFIGKATLATGIAEKTLAKYVTIAKAGGRTNRDIKASLDSFAYAMKKVGMTSDEAAVILDKVIAKTPDIQALFGVDAPQKFTEATVQFAAQLKKTFGPAGAGVAESVMGKLTEGTSQFAIISGAASKAITDPYERLKTGVGAAMKMQTAWRSTNSAFAKEALAESRGLTVGEMEYLLSLGKTEDAAMTKIDTMKAMAEEGKKSSEVEKGAADATGTLMEELSRMYEDIMPDLRDAFMELKPAIIEAVKNLKPFIKDFMAKVPQYLPMIIDGFTMIIGVFKTIIPIAEFLAGLVIGWFEAWWVICEPIFTALGDIWGVIVKLGQAIGIFGEGTSSALETGRMLGKVLYVAFNSLGTIMMLPLHAIRWISEAVGDLIGAMFGSGWLHIPEGIAVVMPMIELLRDAFGWVWEKVQTLAGTIGGFFQNIIPSGVEIAKTAIDSLLLPFKAVGKAIGWVKSLLFGSKFMHIPEGAGEASTAISGLNRSFSGMGESVEMEAARLEKAFGSSYKVMAGWDRMSQAQKQAIASSAHTSVSKLGYEYEKAKLSKQYTGITYGGDAATATPVRRELSNEMGRESDEAKYLRDMVEKLARLFSGIGEIVTAMADSGKQPKEIKDLLAKWLPKIAERPSDLGPSVAAW